MTTDQFVIVVLVIGAVVAVIKIRERYPKFWSKLFGSSSKSAPVEDNGPRIAELELAMKLIEGDVLQSDVDVTTPAILKKDELLLHQAQGYLLEYVQGPSKFQSGAAGVSFGIGGGVRMNVGGSEGQIQAGEESLTAVDQGYIVFTSDRIVFAGSRESREWVLAKISSAQGIENRSGFMIGYSTRQKLEGLKSLTDEPLVWALELSNAVSQGDRETAKRKINDEIARLNAPKV
jgi:hypothetical protein